MRIQSDTASKSQEELSTIRTLLKRRSDEVDQLQRDLKASRESLNKAEAEARKHRDIANSSVQAKQNMATVCFESDFFMVDSVMTFAFCCLFLIERKALTVAS